MAEYIDAKKNIFRFQQPDGRLVLNYENEITKAMASEAKGQVTFFSSASEPQSTRRVYERGGAIFLGDTAVLQTSDILIPGRHNVENYMAAIAAVDGYVDRENIEKVARRFPGVEHRIEFVKEIGGVKFYNSSIDSSPTRTAAALRSFHQKVIVILGGYDKNIPFGPLAEPVQSCVKQAVLTGKTAGKIKQAIAHTGVPICEEDDFEQAVRKAAALAAPGDIVLLSPACASFDAFPNFMARGNKFKEIVNSLS